MPNFPLISELPTYMSTYKWDWHRIHRPEHPSDGFWIGSDGQGNRWLTKLRGSFYAYREVLFGRLAQAMKWSCQSTLFIRLDRTSAELLGGQTGDVHAAHWFVEEHTNFSCGEECALKSLINQEVRTIEDLQSSEVQHLLDWPKSEIAAYIFGGNELPGQLITTEHEFVIIDAEQMFSTAPSSFDTATWLIQSDGSPSHSGQALAIEVCKEISKLPNELIAQALTVPSEIQVELQWPITPKLRKGIEFATAYTDLPVESLMIGYRKIRGRF